MELKMINVPLKDPFWPGKEKPLCPSYNRCRINPVALSWLTENRQALRAAGWKPCELYRRNKSRGICWAGVWGQSGLSVVIESSGCINFHFKAPTGQTIRQTAWPRNHKKRNHKK